MHGNGNEDHPAFDRADDRPDRYFRDSDPSRKIFAWYMVSCQQFYQRHRRRSLSSTLHPFSFQLDCCSSSHLSDLDAHLFILETRSSGISDAALVWRASLNWEQLTDKWAVAPGQVPSLLAWLSHEERSGGESLSFFPPLSFCLD